MKTRKFLFIFNISFPIFLASCNVFYFPTTHNTPMLTQKGELQISGLMDGYLNFDIQTSYAVSDHIGLMLNGSYKSFWLVSTDDPSWVSAKPHIYAEAGVGYFGKVDNEGMFEIFIGGGMGKAHGNVLIEDTNAIEVLSGTLTKFFVQPAVGTSFEHRFIFKSTVEYNLALRLSAVNLLNETKFFAEPGLVMKIGGKSVRMIHSVGYSLQLHGNKSSLWVHQPFTFGFGIQVAIGRRFDRE